MNEAELERDYGHPGALWAALQELVQDRGVRRFEDIQEDWLRLMWSLDAYRVAGVAPRGMGKPGLSTTLRLGGIYREKGNWFSTLCALLVQNNTAQQVRPRTKVEGFSQMHQIDLAWPSREIDPLVCAEVKVTGAPAYGDTPARSALSDFANRRKEIKFAATDLKLNRRLQETSIRHWGAWRVAEPPKVFLLWAARLKGGSARSRDSISALLREAKALTDTYLDGVGVVAWRERDDGFGYEIVPFPPGSRATSLDDVLHRIGSEIQMTIERNAGVPAPVRSNRRVVVDELTSD